MVLSWCCSVFCLILSSRVEGVVSDRRETKDADNEHEGDANDDDNEREDNADDVHEA